MPIALEQCEESSLVRLVGVIDISCAAELKTLLLQALGSGNEVRVSLDQTSYLDVTAIQLLWAATREANRAGARFVLKGEVPEPVSIALCAAGFPEFPVPTDAS